ncbi:DUF1648 domain-containing protein [Actinophytocola sediminis]
MRHGTRRILLAGVPQVLAVVPAAVLLVATWDRLPAQLATHFAADGSVNDQLSRQAMLIGMVGLGLVLAVALGLVNRPLWGVPVSKWDIPRLHVVFSWALAGFLGVVLFMVVAGNLDAGDPATVTMPAGLLLYAFGAAVVAGVIGAVLAPRSAATRDDHDPPTMDLAPGERVSWSRPMSSPWLAALGVLLAVGGVLLGWSVGWGTGWLVVVAGLLVCLLSSAKVTVDRRGTTVAFTALGWPRTRVALDRTESAVAEHVSPAQFGGWGYRIVPGASGFLLRSGTALVLTRTSGRRFVVTVDDAETAARVVNGLRDRQG